MQPTGWATATLLAVGLFGMIATGTSAQPEFVASIIAENEALGGGCNPIGVAVPSTGTPIAPSQDWLVEHMACFGGTVETTAQCQGVVRGDRRLELCTLIIVRGDETTPVACPDFQLFTSLGPYSPDPVLTDEWLAVMFEAGETRNMGPWAALFSSCTSMPVLASNTAIVAVFDIDRTNDAVVFRGRAGEGPAEQVAFIVDEVRNDLPS